MQAFDISLEKMQEAFEKMEKTAGWDTKEKLHWGYYFLDHNKEKLTKFAKQLNQTGYETVEIRKAEDNLYLLHAERQGVLSSESLFEQCLKLKKFASNYEIEIFDGWDVGKKSMK